MYCPRARGLAFRPRNVVVVLAWCLACRLAGAGEPYHPDHDDVVLEKLAQGLLTQRGELNALRDQLKKAPNDHLLAVKLAGRYMELGGREGDPRLFGYARAALRPWWEAPHPPTEVLRIRAKLLEKEHAYGEALLDTRAILAKQPQDVQAWINLANLLRVQGNYAEAESACESLAGFAGNDLAVYARAPLWGVTGRAKEAQAALAALLPKASENGDSAVRWILTVQAELAQAEGNWSLAEEKFKEALRIAPGDFYLLRAYSDLLLDLGRPQEVLPLLKEHLRDEGVLLRSAIAAKLCHQSALAAQLRNQLTDRFRELRLRGDAPHARFEARFELVIQQNAQNALALAAENWAKQKEVSDSRILLEASIASKNREAGRPVAEFLQAHGTRHATLDALVAEWERLP